MMKHLQLYSKLDILKLTRKRTGEVKMGEMVQSLPDFKNSNLLATLKKTTVKFVLVGLPEDIGIRANFGRGGAHSAWLPALTNLLNMQSNSFFSGEDLLILGHVNFDDLMKKADSLNMAHKESLIEMRKMVDKIDARVAPIIETIIAAGKEAIVVGGGHNNAFPNIKGATEALRKVKKNKALQLAVINCDAHTDFRKQEGRHSGNGFRFAFDHQYLAKYSMVGLHENYNSATIIKELEDNKKVFSMSYFEDIFVRQNLPFEKAIKKAIDHSKNCFCGLEIDMDSVQNIPTSAKTSSGISTIQARQFVHLAASKTNCVYLHIAEAAPVLSHIKADNKTGKLIAYLISDYIKARSLKKRK